MSWRMLTGDPFKMVKESRIGALIPRIYTGRLKVICDCSCLTHRDVTPATIESN
jgi:hypothetical protein